MRQNDEPARQALEMGVEGLDEILHGGLPPDCMYLVEGDPGSGKTTLALQFLMEGVRRGESGLLVTLSESEDELRDAAKSHNWSLDGITILELISTDENLKDNSRYTMFHPSEVELTQTTQAVLDAAKKVCPGRVVFDSLSSLRLLAQSSLRYRRQVLALKHFFSTHKCTIVLIDDKTGNDLDVELHSICHGIISLEKLSPAYGVMRRRLQVLKMRGKKFREGYHDFVIETGGMRVFPRLVASEHEETHARESIPSGIEALDQMLGGGLTRGTSNLLMGPAGTGKSTIASQYALRSALEGHHTSVFLFDESIATYLERSRSLGMEIDRAVESGKLSLRQIDPAELSPGEFSHLIHDHVKDSDTRIVVIDSLNGYINAMPNEKLLTLHLHELLAYLGKRGVTTILIMAQHGLLGSEMVSPVDTSYLADTVFLLRFFEAGGSIRQAISVVKKRTGQHERSIRELTASSKGLAVSEPLREFQGILQGSPFRSEP